MWYNHFENKKGKGGNNLNKELMQEAIDEAKKNAVNNYKDGGPFGAIIEKEGKIIARGHNTVIVWLKILEIPIFGKKIVLKYLFLTNIINLEVH